MSKLTRRLLCIAAIVVFVTTLGIFALANSAQEPEDIWEPVCYEHGDVNGDGKVNNKDAIYIMYNYLFGDSMFPIEQVWDYNKDGKTNNQDAFYVMYHYMFEDNPNYQLGGTVHSYYDPTWVWDEQSNTAQVTFKCGCGTPVTYTESNGVTVTAGAVVSATCVEAGSETYEASVTVGGQVYTNAYVKTLPAGDGHNMSGEPDCENGSECSLCDHTLPALGHNWELEGTQSATCTANAVQTYRCGTCGDTKEVEQEGTAGHVLGYLEDRQNGCKYVKWYKCANCDHTEAGTAASDTYYNHTYTATLTKEATCVSTGVKTYVCQCGAPDASYTEEIPVNDSHKWDKGTEVGTVTTHTCENPGCNTTKTTVDAKKNALLSKDDLKNELQLDGGASMSLDQDAVEALDKNETVTVSITPLKEDDALMDKLSEEQKAQIGDNTVYDFNMAYSNGDQISEFGGEVTISLPYKLDDDEDVDSIDVWYIDDDGIATRVTGTYSNGFVTFTTTHFSYYTVTRLTPAERCNRYGHILVTAKKAATCAQDGYDMSVCQRCGHVEKDEVLPHLEHDYEENTVAATCKQAGSVIKTCKRTGCNHKVTVAIPTLSHDMQKDETKSVKASCTSAGKEVYVCSREGCDHTREETAPQLTHNYQTVEEKTADCTSKGYTKKQCTLCDNEIILNETTPTGHTYQVSSWRWSEDHYSAEAVLTCTHNSGHTKTLSAVVTEKKNSATCSGSGTVVFTATASFNQVTYTDTYTQTTEAIGHKPGAEWESDAAQHYHICSVCSEPVDATSHTWDDGTVTKEPTCNTAGSATYECTVCGYEKEKVLPATKNHNYVNGVCSACGKAESECIHQKVTGTEMDLTGWDICEDSQIIKYSCECGENVTYDWNLLCDMPEETETEEVIEYNGQQCVKTTRSCADCGLTMSYFTFMKIDDDACIGSYAQNYTISVTGQEDLVSIYNYTGKLEHPGVTMENVDLTTEEYGLCGEILVKQTCGCEEKVVRTSTLKSCKWIYEGNNNGCDIYRCTNCGAKRVSEYTYEEPKDSCFMEETDTVTYYVDDVQVYTFTNYYRTSAHKYKAISWELLGTSCEDGILIDEVCADCGDTRERYTEYHQAVIEETADLSGYDICIDSIVLTRCACEENYQGYEIDSDTNCDWNWMSYDEKTQTDTYTCRECKAVRTVQVVEGEKQEDCKVVTENVTTFKQSDGTLLCVCAETDYNYEHRNVVDYTLKGETCEDGVVIKKVCQDCGAKESYTTYGHSTFEKARYDLASYGMCGGEIIITGCACRESESIRWNKTSCNWQEIGGCGDEGFEQFTYYCSECDCYYDAISEWNETENPCVEQYVRTYKFYKGSMEAPQVLLNFSSTRMTTQHTTLATFELNNSELGCAGGYKVINTCQVCGNVETYTNYGGDEDYHERYLVDKETYSSDLMCGDVVVSYYSCPCGKSSSGGWNLWENGCAWNYVNGTMNSSTYRCDNCKTEHTTTSRNQKVEGETCARLYTTNAVFTNGETELFRFSIEEISYDHRYVYTFQMNGATCQDGFYAYGNCADCGDTTWMTDWGCCPYPTNREVLANDPSACGIVEWVESSCPCGYATGKRLESSCAWDWEGYDEDGADIYVCATCGMRRVEKMESQRIPGTCQYQTTKSGVLTIGEKSYTYSKNYTETNHKTIYRMTLLGETCEDGVQVTAICAYCDYVGSTWTEYGHFKRPVVFYNLEDYGMCGGQISQSSCACGKESSWSWDVSYCEGRNTGKIDPDTGDYEHYCEKCQSFYSWGEEGELNTDTCLFEGEFYFKLRNAEETLINVRGTTSRQSHTTRVVHAELVNPGTDCESGVRYYWQCEYCGYGWDDIGYGHGTYPVDTIETGCGGSIYMETCACGKNKQVSNENPNCNMSHNYYTETDENGVLHEFTDRACQNCGVRIINEWYNIPVENCIVQQTNIYTITIGDQEKVFRYTEETEEHQNTVYTYTLAPGSENCEDGIIVTESCPDCGYSDFWYSNGHSTYVRENVHLPDFGACSGELQFITCACGQKQEMRYEHLCTDTYDTWETVGENGVTYEFELRTCSQCGLKMQSVSHKEATDVPCEYTVYTDITVQSGDSQWSARTTGFTTVHDLQYTYALKEGAKSCIDGIVCTETCRVCDYSHSWDSYYHATTLVESIDLAETGSVCGGSLNIYRCPCGSSYSSQIEGDKYCDLETTPIDVWIENALNEQRPTIDGDWTTSYAYEYRCAVTDPEVCGYVIRVSTHYLKEGCHAVQYETWQLGYDEETGTCQKEITYVTGNRKGYHDYEVTEVDSTGEDGIRVVGKWYVCPDCQSSYHHLSEYDAKGVELRYEEVYENLLNDGQQRYRGRFSTYELINDCNYETRTRYEYVYADGSEFWFENNYIYDPDNCKKTMTYVNSRDEGNSQEEEWHLHTTYNSETLDATCSQPGYYRYWYTCNECGEITSDYTTTYTPGHKWDWNSNLGTYVCIDCDLKCDSGADGAVVMEDLTEEQGNGTEYVIGYYNPDEHLFLVNVSVILEDAEGDDNQIELMLTQEDITYYTTEANGFTGLSVNKELADAAAAEAVAALGDYEGAYAIRIAFVPVNSSFTLDYAITFDSVTAE